ncbi:MAG: aspartate kinase, monofunctional class [Pyrinomonadaceae bacterium]
MSNKIQVMKFGGTSIGDADRIKRVSRIITDENTKGHCVVVVVSAMNGVTNRLVAAAHSAAKGEEAASYELGRDLRKQHAEAIKELVSNEVDRARLATSLDRIIGDVESLCRGTALLRDLTPRAFDAISGVGEKLSSHLIAASVSEFGANAVAIEATELIVTNEEYGKAEPYMAQTRESAQARLLPLLNEGKIPIVTGFIGATKEGILTTLGRGGSDYSATILGAALDAAEVIIWTDTDGVMTADPRLVVDARTLRQISYNEAAELAYFGARVLHPKTLKPVIGASIPVWIRSSFEPEKPGTRISHASKQGSDTQTDGVKAVTAIRDVSLITVNGCGMVGLPGVAAKAFAAAASAHANILMISQSSSEYDICFVVPTPEAERTARVLRLAFAHDLAHHEVDQIDVDSNVAIVAVIGERMRGTAGIAGRTFSAIGSAGINIIVIAQGSSEYNISFVVEAGTAAEAVVCLHREFDLARRFASGNVETLSSSIQLQPI